jgi:glucose/arabinose dehydrogenase
METPAASRRICALLSGLVVLSVAIPLTPAEGAALPQGFTETQIATGFNRPYAMAFAPDGRLFVSLQGGRIRVIKNGVLLSTPFVTLKVDTHGDRGAIGIAFDLDFSTDHYVYVYYTATTPTIHNRVSRFTANGDVAVPGSEQVLFDVDDLGTSGLHNGGSLQFRADGKLYITTGDNVQPATAQSMTSTLGKVLRINPDGTIPSDNPFYSTTTGKDRAIWALGLRNPFTSGLQPGTDRYFLDDVGASSWEEIDEGIPGANYGWPLSEGVTSDPRFTSPIFAYAHGSTSTTGCAIAGGAFYNPPVATFPAAYVGNYFFADHCSGWIRRLDPSNGYAVSDFITAADGPIALQTGPDGSLYYLSRDDSTLVGSVFKVTYSGLPAISQQPSDVIVAPGDPATFSITAGGQQPLSYQWKRDGADIPGANSSSYTLSSPSLSDDGARFLCVVSNSLGTTTSLSAKLTVTTDAAPVATIASPREGAHYDAGDVITYEGTGTDTEDGTLPASAFTWEIVFHHNTHTHEFIAPFSGVTSGTFTVPNTGETDADVWYRIHLTVKDSVGLTNQTYRDVVPNTATLSFATVPAGLAITLDSQPVTAPFSSLNVVGMERTLGVVSPQTVNGIVYQFASWSDTGSATHVITTPATDTTYTATYQAGPDTIKPTVTITAPTAGATVSGTVTLAVDASDNVGVTRVKWFFGSAMIATDGDGVPWTKPWNSTTVANGSYKLIAKARDAAGNWGASKGISITVNNP